jgi:hypothetical protein
VAYERALVSHDGQACLRRYYESEAGSAGKTRHRDLSVAKGAIARKQTCYSPVVVCCARVNGGRYKSRAPGYRVTSVYARGHDLGHDPAVRRRAIPDSNKKPGPGTAGATGSSESLAARPDGCTTPAK